MLVAFIRPLAPAVGHIIVSGMQTDGYIENAVALCGESTERMQVDVAVVCGDKLTDVDCKRCLRMFSARRPTVAAVRVREAISNPSNVPQDIPDPDAGIDRERDDGTSDPNPETWYREAQ